MTKPLFLKGVTKDYIWGGQKLRELFGKKSDSENIAESWELSCNKDGISTVTDSENGDMPLTEYIEKYGAENVLGRECMKTESVPLIKLIDAKEPLSVQVHPDDNYARKKGFPNGKTEMWYVIDAEEDSKLVYGVNKELTREELRQHIEDGTLEEVLNYVPVKKGDVFYIPSGTLHAIGKGILIAEVQQNCNLTYRVYDYNRKDSEGNPRELHIEDAVNCAHLIPTEINQPFCNMDIFEYPFGSSRILCACDYFVTCLIKEKGKAVWSGLEELYRHILILDGKGTLETDGQTYDIKKGDSILLPPMKGDYCMKGDLEYLSTLSLDAEEIAN